MHFGNRGLCIFSSPPEPWRVWESGCVAGRMPGWLCCCPSGVVQVEHGWSNSVRVVPASFPVHLLRSHGASSFSGQLWSPASGVTFGLLLGVVRLSWSFHPTGALVPTDHPHWLTYYIRVCRAGWIPIRSLSHSLAFLSKKTPSF